MLLCIFFHDADRGSRIAQARFLWVFLIAKQTCQRQALSTGPKHFYVAARNIFLSYLGRDLAFTFIGPAPFTSVMGYTIRNAPFPPFRKTGVISGSHSYLVDTVCGRANRDKQDTRGGRRTRCNPPGLGAPLSPTLLLRSANVWPADMQCMTGPCRGLELFGHGTRFETRNQEFPPWLNGTKRSIYLSLTGHSENRLAACSSQSRRPLPASVDDPLS